jgi:sortase A
MLVAGLLIVAQALFIPAKAGVAQAMLERSWERATRGEAERPWPWADFHAVGRIGLPDGTWIVALSDAAGESLAFGPTLVAGSVEPGERGVAVFAAHRDTHFAGIGRLQAGDLVTVETPGGLRTFAVTGSEVVRWDASGIEPRDGGPARIALVTCWPLDGAFRGPLRYVVWAEAVPAAA